MNKQRLDETCAKGNKAQIKSLLKKVMSDIENFKKEYEQDNKTIRNLTAEKQKLYQRVRLLLKENQSLRDLARLPADNNADRRVAKVSSKKNIIKKLGTSNVKRRQNIIRARKIPRMKLRDTFLYRNKKRKKG